MQRASTVPHLDPRAATMSDRDPRNASSDTKKPADQPEDSSPVTADHADGGPGSHTEDQTGGVTNDPDSGGVSEAADDQDESRLAPCTPGPWLPESNRCVRWREAGRDGS